MSVLDYRLLNFSVPEQAEEWRAILQELAKPNVYLEPDWLALHGGPRAEQYLVVVRLAGGLLLLPFVARPLRALPWCPDELAEAVDLAGPAFGWTGPFVVGEASADEKEHVWTIFRDVARALGAISDYRLFSPVEAPPRSYPGHVHRKMSVVVKTLPDDPGRLLETFAAPPRRRVRKSTKQGVVVTTELDHAHLDAFVDVYHRTMARRQAEPRYFFPRHYFVQLRRLEHAVKFFVAYHEGELIAGDVVLCAGDDLYAYLAGARREMFHLSPAVAIKYHTMVWASGQGYAHYVLGGGNREDDSIFAFKRSFAPKEPPRETFVGRWVVDERAYSRAVMARQAFEESQGRQWSASQSFFPSYRAP